MSKSVKSQNYHLGNMTELGALMEFFDETIMESDNGPHYYSITVKKSVDLKTFDSIV